jgi:hypothetical protein
MLLFALRHFGDAQGSRMERYLRDAQMYRAHPSAIFTPT